MTETACLFQFYRFRINPPVAFDEAEMSLQLAIVALEGLYGEARMRLEARYKADVSGKTLAIDVRTRLGVELAQVFTSLLIKEFGPDSFTIGRLADAGEAEREP